MVNADSPGPGAEQPTQPVPVHGPERRVERLERRIEKAERRYGQANQSAGGAQPAPSAAQIQPGVAQQQAIQAAQVAHAIQIGPQQRGTAPVRRLGSQPQSQPQTQSQPQSQSQSHLAGGRSGSYPRPGPPAGTAGPAPAEQGRDARRHHGGLHRRKLRLTGMRTRLLAGFAAVALATASIITGSSYLLMRTNLIKQVQSNAQSQLVEDVDTNGAQMAAASSGQQLSALANQVARNGGIVVLKSDNGTGTSDSAFELGQVPKAFQTAAQAGLVQERVLVDGTPYELTGAKIAPDGPEIYLFTSLASEQAVLNKLVTIGVASAGLALFAAIIVAFLATRNVLVPIRRLGLAARRLGEGDLDVRLEVKGADEIADVSRTFNETAAALARSMDELRAMDAASRRFVADVSHELRTPLTAMTAVTEVLEDVDGADLTTMSAAHLIANETKRLARLVEDLMEISRFDAGTAAMRLEDINLPELLAATLAARGWTAKAAVTSPTVLGVVVDARRLDVVIANLVGNALRHGGEPVAVDVWEDEGWATVQVADSGPGVPPDALPHIFDRFYKADRARGRSEGSGLGLSIAFENARMHGGALSVRNRAEGGAVFTFRFPVQPASAQQPSPGLAGLPDSRPGGRGPAHRTGGGQVEEVNA